VVDAALVRGHSAAHTLAHELCQRAFDTAAPAAALDLPGGDGLLTALRFPLHGALAIPVSAPVDAANAPSASRPEVCAVLTLYSDRDDQMHRRHGVMGPSLAAAAALGVVAGRIGASLRAGEQPSIAGPASLRVTFAPGFRGASGRSPPVPVPLSVLGSPDDGQIGGPAPAGSGDAAAANTAAMASRASAASILTASDGLPEHDREDEGGDAGSDAAVAAGRRLARWASFLVSALGATSARCFVMGRDNGDTARAPGWPKLAASVVARGDPSPASGDASSSSSSSPPPPGAAAAASPPLELAEDDAASLAQDCVEPFPMQRWAELERDGRPGGVTAAVPVLCLGAPDSDAPAPGMDADVAAAGGGVQSDVHAAAAIVLAFAPAEAGPASAASSPPLLASASVASSRALLSLAALALATVLEPGLRPASSPAVSAAARAAAAASEAATGGSAPSSPHAPTASGSPFGMRRPVVLLSAQRTEALTILRAVAGEHVAPVACTDADAALVSTVAIIAAASDVLAAGVSPALMGEAEPLHHGPAGHPTASAAASAAAGYLHPPSGLGSSVSAALGLAGLLNPPSAINGLLSTASFGYGGGFASGSLNRLPVDADGGMGLPSASLGQQAAGASALLAPGEDVSIAAHSLASLASEDDHHSRSRSSIHGRGHTPSAPPSLPRLYHGHQDEHFRQHYQQHYHPHPHHPQQAAGVYGSIGSHGSAPSGLAALGAFSPGFQQQYHGQQHDAAPAEAAPSRHQPAASHGAAAVAHGQRAPKRDRTVPATSMPADAKASRSRSRSSVGAQPASLAMATSGGLGRRTDRVGWGDEIESRTAPGAGKIAGARRAAAFGVPLRKGKWPTEETLYVDAVKGAFEDGLLPLPEGVTLRAMLAVQLHCAPMRITKKFAGDTSLGKKMYRRNPECLQPAEWKRRSDERLAAIAHLRQQLCDRLETSPGPFRLDHVVDVGIGSAGYMSRLAPSSAYEGVPLGGTLRLPAGYVRLVFADELEPEGGMEAAASLGRGAQAAAGRVAGDGPGHGGPVAAAADAVSTGGGSSGGSRGAAGRDDGGAGSGATDNGDDGDDDEDDDEDDDGAYRGSSRGGAGSRRKSARLSARVEPEPRDLALRIVGHHGGAPHPSPRTAAASALFSMGAHGETAALAGQMPGSAAHGLPTFPPQGLRPTFGQPPPASSPFGVVSSHGLLPEHGTFGAPPAVSSHYGGSGITALIPGVMPPTILMGHSMGTLPRGSPIDRAASDGDGSERH